MDKVKDLELLKFEKDPSQSSGLVSGLTAMRNSLLRESKELETFSNQEAQTCMSSLFTVGKAALFVNSYKRVFKNTKHRSI